MNLKKRAAGAIAVAMSVVVMTSVAQAAPADYKNRCGITGNNDGLSYKWNCRNRSIYESV